MFSTQKQSLAAMLMGVAARGFVVVMRLPALIFDLPLCSFSRKISDRQRQTITERLEAGDVLLTSDKLFPLWQFTVALLGSPKYSHAAIYEGDGVVIEATTFHPSGDGVAHTGIDDFLSGRKNICVLRPDYPQYGKEAMLAWLAKQLGKPYDYLFDGKGEQAMYCAKLIGKAMCIAGLSVDTRRLLRRDIYLPDAFMRSAGIISVYCGQKMRGGKLAYCLPVMAVIPLFVINPATSILSCGAVFLLLIIVGWLQHLKII